MLDINKHHPIAKAIKINYTVEYTNEVERDPDFENIHQLPNIIGLEDAIDRMYALRKQGRHNISIGYEVKDKETDKLIFDDFAYDLEYYTDTNQEDKLQKELSKQAKTITELVKELELHQQFLDKYNAMDRFKKEIKGE